MKTITESKGVDKVYRWKMRRVMLHCADLPLLPVAPNVTRSNPDFTILQIPQEFQSHNTYCALSAHVTNALKGVERA